MKCSILVVFSLFIVGIYGAVVSDLPPVSITTDIPFVEAKTKTTKTTTESSTSTTTPVTSSTSTTTTEATTTNTPKPEPTPTSTTTTTTPTSTSTTTTSTSTTPTTTTSTSTSTTTAKPEPPTKPGVGKYSLTENNTTCIVLEFAAQLNFSYSIEPNKTEYFVYNLPSDKDFQKSKGSCGNGSNVQYIFIEWPEQNSLNLTFHLNETKKSEISLYEAVFNLSANVVPNNNKTFTFYHVKNEFEVPKGNSYHCGSERVANLTDSSTSSNVVGTVTVSQVTLQAFHTGKDTKYASAIDCEGINTPDIVPIAVGIALIALVVVVLIAYLVGRRRAQARGYVSM